MTRHKIFQILFGLFFTLFVKNSFADCSSNGFRIFPRTNSISTNPIFIIEGYVISESVVRNLNNGNAIYLTSGNDTIPLTVIKTLKSQFHLTQAILKPISNLILGKSYKLNIDNLDEYEKRDFDRDSIAWIVNDVLDVQKPIWSKFPSYKSKQMVFFGCGPEVYVNFCACISDNSPVVVYAKVKKLNTQSYSDYYLNPDSCTIQLGHGMCSGEFDFEEGQEYEVTFSLMDASGNISDELQPIKFISPTKNDQRKIDDSEINCKCFSQKTTNALTTLWIIISLVAVTLVVLSGLLRKPK